MTAELSDQTYAGQQDLPVLDGLWESDGKSPATAAMVALLGIGALYFNAESILMTVVIAVGGLVSNGPVQAGDFFERLTQFMKFYAGPIRIVVFVSQYLFILLPALWLVRRWHTREVRRYIRLNGCSPLEIILAVVGTVLLMPAANWIASRCTESLHIPQKLMEINAELFTARSPGELVWLIIVTCITPAICEEIFFRGYIQRTLERSIGWKSILLVGVAFGLFHFQPLGLISLSMLGILFGIFYYRSKSLLPGMAAHFTNNLLSILLLYQSVSMPESGLSSTLEQLPFLFVAATLPVEAGILIIYFRITARRTDHSRPVG